LTHINHCITYENKQAQEEIAAADAIAQLKNALILNNLAARDAELTEALNKH
jgi:hypothetical protein